VVTVKAEGLADLHEPQYTQARWMGRTFIHEGGLLALDRQDRQESGLFVLAEPMWMGRPFIYEGGHLALAVVTTYNSTPPGQYIDIRNTKVN
jgi:hypothetical protein